MATDEMIKHSMCELYTTCCGYYRHVNRGSCFALPLGQRPKDTARTERKPDHNFEEKQTRTEYKYV